MGGESAMRDAFAVGSGDENGGMALDDDGALDAAASPAREPDVDVSDAVPGESDVGGAGCIEACGADGMCEFAGDDGESGVWEESGERDGADEIRCGVAESEGGASESGEREMAGEASADSTGARKKANRRGKRNKKTSDQRAAMRNGSASDR